MDDPVGIRAAWITRRGAIIAAGIVGVCAVIGARINGCFDRGAAINVGTTGDKSPAFVGGDGSTFNLNQNPNNAERSESLRAVPPPFAEPYVPLRNNESTILPIQNDGTGPRLIQAVSFKKKHQMKTPVRPDLSGKPISIPIRFLPKHRVRNDEFRLILRERVELDEGEFADLKIAIIQPEKIGWTYIGTVTVYFDSDTPYVVDRDVELDVLATEPEE